MSTKVSLSYGPKFHLYQEMFDCDNVYLQIDGHEFEISNNRAMIQIPLEVWNKIIEEWPKSKDRFINQTADEWVSSLDETIIFTKRNK